MSRKIVDLYLDLPSGEDLYIQRLGMFCLGNDKIRHAGYRDFFGDRLVHQELELSFSVLDKIVEEQGKEAFIQTVRDAAQKVSIPIDQFIQRMDRLGVAWGFTGSHDRDNLKTAALCAQYPDRLLGAAYIDPGKRDAAVSEFEHCVHELKLSGLYISPIRIGMQVNDPRCFPLYAKAQELDIPVFLYTTNNFKADLPMDIGHPRHIDDVARIFPKLRIMATCGGWPWSGEMVALVLRHSNIYFNLEMNEPAFLTEQGRGMEIILYAIQKMGLWKKFCFASNWAMQGLPLETIINQMYALPLDDHMLDAIMYDNAARFMKFM